MKDLYYNNVLFKEYVDRYCKQHRIAKDVAFTHALVKAYAEYVQQSQ